MSGTPGLLTNRVWVDPVTHYEEATLQRLCAQLDICEGLGRILAARDLTDVGEADRFLRPSPEHMHDPFLLKGMETAVDRIILGIERFEKIVIFGDYDVDGTASTALFYNYLKRLGARVYYFIPDRIADGFGLSLTTAQKLHADQPDLIITVDTGSTAVVASQFLSTAGIDLLVTDHHQVGEVLPTTVALVNPHQPGCPYPFKELSATGVAYKVLCALDWRLTERNFWDIRGICHTEPNYYLDLVALATVADLSPLVGENRVLVKEGLEMLNKQPRPGLASLIKECNVRHGVLPSTINFKVAPRINALGRVGDPRLGIQLLLTGSYTEGRRLARQISLVNRERQEIERLTQSQAMKQLEPQWDGPAFVLVGQDWHQGVIGIIATRIAYQYRKPTVVLTLSADGLAIGSARGYGFSNVLATLKTCGTLLERFGGHDNACGLALKPSNIELFRERFLAEVTARRDTTSAAETNAINIDAWVGVDDLHERFMSEIPRLSPFGHGNPEPVLGVKALNLSTSGLLGREEVRIKVQNGEGPHTRYRPAADVPELLSGTFDIVLSPRIRYSHDGLRSHLKVFDARVLDA